MSLITILNIGGIDVYLLCRDSNPVHDHDTPPPKFILNIDDCILSILSEQYQGL